MSRIRKQKVNKVEDEFIEFVLKDDAVTSAEPLKTGIEPVKPEFTGNDIFSKRPEQLSVKEFVALTNMLEKP